MGKKPHLGCVIIVFCAVGSHMIKELESFLFIYVIRSCRGAYDFYMKKGIYLSLLSLLCGACFAEPIKHRFIATDESGHQFIYVDQFVSS